MGSAAAPAIAPHGQAKTVLMIDYYFPPLAGAGAQRTLGYVRYLTRFGWEPIVLTVRSGDGNFYDSSLLGRIPESVEVQRTSSLEPIKVARWLFAKPRAQGNSQGNGLYRRMGPLERAIQRMRGIEFWLLFPDRYVGWAPFAVARALDINRRRPIDLVYSTSTAITSHVVGLIVKKILAKPWVADFQDAWAERPGFAKRLFPSSLHASMARRLESLIVRGSDHVVVTADPLRRTFVQPGKDIPPDKVTVIPMGYDPALFDHVRAIRRSKFTITHFGSFYATRSPGPFLDALGQCIRRHPELSGRLEVLFFGTFDPAIRDFTLSTIDRWRLHDVVHLKGQVSYEAGVQQLVSSEVLLLIGDPGEWHQSAIPAKLYEYLAARRPILALMPDGPTAGILRGSKAGLIIPPNDVPAIEEAIWNLYQWGRSGRLTFAADHSVLAKYSWNALARHLASIFDAVLLTGSSSKGPRSDRCQSSGSQAVRSK